MNTGQTLAHFEIIRTLGKGGMGEVYLAQDTKLKRKVVIKVLHRCGGCDGCSGCWPPVMISQFVAEGTACTGELWREL